LIFIEAVIIRFNVDIQGLRLRMPVPNLETN